MRKFLLGLALLVPTVATAQTPYRGQSGFDTGPVVTCIALDGSGTGRCLVPGTVIYDTTGAPLGTAGNPFITSSTGGATAANQTNGTQQVQGNTPSGSPYSANPFTGACVVSMYNASGLTSGNNQYLLCTTNGDLRTISNVWNGTAYAQQRGDATGTFTVEQPVATPSAGVAPTGADGATSAVLKASTGNLYAVNDVNSTVAHFLVVLNATVAPTSGTATPVGTATGNRMYCMPVAASVGFRDTFNPPLNASAGVVLLASTNCTTYTPIGTAPITLTGQVK